MTATCNDAVRQRAILRNGCWIGTRPREIVRCVIFTRDCTVREFECGNFSLRYSVHSPNSVYSPTAVCRRRLRVDPILLGEFVMPILLWHLPLVIFFGSWDVAVSPSEKGEVWKRTSMPSQHVKRRNYRPSEILQVEAAAARACCKPARDGWRRCATALRFRRCK